MGSHLSTPMTEKCSEDGENYRIRYGSSTMQGWRTTMEDAIATVPDLDSSTSFFGVYDGHKGKQVALFCAKHLHQQMVKDEAYTSGDLVTSIQNAYFRMDELMQGQSGWRELAMLQGKFDKISDVVEGSAKKIDDQPVEEESHSDFAGPNAGSTACVAIIQDKQLIVANAGDSRCVICKRGMAFYLSIDHKPDLENEKRRILKAGGSVRSGRVNGSLNLSRAIGDMQFKKNIHLPAAEQAVTSNPEITTIGLGEEDEFLVVACDGIWDCMSDQDLVCFVREQLKTESKLSKICEKVFDKCLAPSASGNGCDNMSMIIVQFKKPTCSVSSQEPPELPDLSTFHSED